MGDRPAAGHDECVVLVLEIAGELEHAACALQQHVEAREARVVEGGAIVFAGKRENRLKLVTELERDVGGDLVGAVGERRHEQEARRAVGEIDSLALEQGCRARLEFDQGGAEPLDDRLFRFVGQGLDPVAGDPDRQSERKPRRMRVRRGLAVQAKVRCFAVQRAGPLCDQPNFLPTKPPTAPAMSAITTAPMARYVNASASWLSVTLPPPPPPLRMSGSMDVTGWPPLWKFSA